MFRAVQKFIIPENYNIYLSLPGELITCLLCDISNGVALSLFRASNEAPFSSSSKTISAMKLQNHKENRRK